MNGAISESNFAHLAVLKVLKCDSSFQVLSYWRLYEGRNHHTQSKLDSIFCKAGLRTGKLYMYVRQVNTLELDLFGLHYDANQKLIGMGLYLS